MKSAVFALFLTVLFVSALVLGCGGGTPTVDLGDRSSGNLVWGVYHYGYVDRDLDKALVYADKTLEIHGADARRMQASLSDFPATDPPEAAFKYKALNDVAAAMLAKGQLLAENGDGPGAEKAFSMVIRDFGYAQIQDLGEWGDAYSSVTRDARGFMKVADLARQALADLEEGTD